MAKQPNWRKRARRSAAAGEPATQTATAVAVEPAAAPATEENQPQVTWTHVTKSDLVDESMVVVRAVGRELEDKLAAFGIERVVRDNSKEELIEEIMRAQRTLESRLP